MEETPKSYILEKLDAYDILNQIRHDFVMKQLDNIMKCQDGFQKDIKEINEKIQNMAIIELSHYDKCPTRQELPILKDLIQKNKNEVDESLLNVRFFSANPNVFFGVIAISVLLFFGVVYAALTAIETRIKDNSEKIKKMEADATKKESADYQKEIKNMNK